MEHEDLSYEEYLKLVEDKNINDICIIIMYYLFYLYINNSTLFINFKSL